MVEVSTKFNNEYMSFLRALEKLELEEQVELKKKRDLMEERRWDIIEKVKGREEIGFDFALLILNQPILCEPDVIISLWKKVSLRVLVNGGASRWLSFLDILKINDLALPDLVSGDFDSITPKVREHFENQKVEMIFTPNQDESDFTKALRCAANVFKRKNLNIKLIIAVCESGGRLDQIMANISTLHCSSQILQDIPVVILSSHSITWVLHPGKHSIFVNEEFIKNQYSCGLIPFCGPTRVTTTGLKWNLDNDTMKMDGLVSTSNTFTATEISVICDRNLVWTTQYCKINK